MIELVVDAVLALVAVGAVLALSAYVAWLQVRES